MQLELRVATHPKNKDSRVATYSEGRIGNPTQYRDQGKILYSGRGKVLGTLNPFLLALNLRVKFYGKLQRLIAKEMNMGKIEILRRGTRLVTKCLRISLWRIRVNVVRATGCTPLRFEI